jgi:DNA-binding Lrp family transcriptional regulator
MSRGRKPAKELSVRDKKIVEQYNSTSDAMPLLAKKYSISKQRIYEILKRAKRLGYVIKRQNLLVRYHDFHQCEVCNKILKIAEKDELITRKHLAQMLSIEVGVCNRHLDRLKGSGFISKKFATIRSDRLVKALRCYKYDSLPPAAVGRKFGYKNFYSILSYQKKKGVNVKRMLKSPLVSNLKQKEPMAIFPSMSQNEF